jgi:ribose transport system ATP-binding protein
VMRVSDRITVLRDGNKIATLEQDSTNVDELISLILGHEMQKPLLQEKYQRERSKILLTVEDLSSDVFENVSFNLAEGEVLGIYGAIGAGHFDLAKAIFGMYRFDSGTIAVDGHKFPKNFSASYAIQHGLAYATESRRKTLMMDEPVYRNIAMPHLQRIGGIFSKTAQEVKVAAAAVTRVNLQPPDPFNAVGKLSGGNLVTSKKSSSHAGLRFPPKFS